MSLIPRPAWALAVALVGLGCTNPGSVLQWQSYAAQHVAVRRIAVIPLSPNSLFVPGPPPNDIDGATAAGLMGRFLAEAIADRDQSVIPPSDLALAFATSGREVPPDDPAAAAELAAAKFSATGVLIGSVSRYRERSGEALGALRPAGVAFEVTLYAAPGGKKLWGARFDETQQAFMDNPLKARRYPGGGTRWLKAAELARWGADQVAKALFTP